MAARVPFALVVALAWAAVVPGARHAFAQDARQPKTHVIVMENMRFTPSTLEISPGDRVTFKNSDLVPHTATTKAKQPFSFDSGNVKPGESWTVSLHAREPIHYACTFHPMMEGVIVVKAPKFSALSP